MADMLEGLRQMPYSLEAEQSVIGSILIEPACIQDVAEILRPDDFYIEQNRLIYETLLEMFNVSMPIDGVTLLEQLRSKGILEQVGGKLYLLQIAESVPTASNVKTYSKIVEEKAYLRRLIEAARDIINDCYESGDDVSNILDLAGQRIYDVANGKRSKGFAKINEVIMKTYERLGELSKNKNAFAGIPTHFSDIDRVLAGLNNSDLILVAARPGMGKTSFALNIAQNIAIKEKKTVAIFSLEMSNEQLVARMLSSEAMVDGYKLRTGELSESDWARLAPAAALLGSSNILLDETSGITVVEMKAKLRRVKNLGLVVIDYLQLMSSAKRHENRVQEVSEISRSLKLMAKDLNVPVMVLSQLSRGPESRQDHRPMLADLRESGAIEQDADVVLFLYREDYYKKDTDKRNICECIVAKNRHGETQSVELQWIGQFTRFMSLEKVRNEP